MASRSKGGPGKRKGRPPTLGYTNKPASKVSPLPYYQGKAGERKSTTPQTSFERGGLNLWCPQCHEVFNGPSKGRYAHTKAEKDQIEREGAEVNRMGGGLNGHVCGRMSCVSKYVDATLFDDLQRRHPDHDYTEARSRTLEVEYEDRRTNTDKYPGGLIEDLDETPAPPIGGSDE